MENFVAALGPMWSAFSNFWRITFWSEVAKINQLGFIGFLQRGNVFAVTVVLMIILAPIVQAWIIMMRVQTTRYMQMEIKGKNILYVIAHPDDEAM